MFSKLNNAQSCNYLTEILDRKVSNIDKLEYVLSLILSLRKMQEVLNIDDQVVFVCDQYTHLGATISKESKVEIK